MERVEKSTYRRVMGYLVAHPTPWRFIRETSADVLLNPRSVSELIAEGYHEVRGTGGEKRDVVEDANGNVVFSSWDRDEWASHIEGDVRALVDFVNLVGEGYEPQHGWDTYNHTADPRWPEELRPFSPEQRQAIADSWEPPNFEEGPLERFIRGYLDGENK